MRISSPVLYIAFGPAGSSLHITYGSPPLSLSFKIFTNCLKIKGMGQAEMEVLKACRYILRGQNLHSTLQSRIAMGSSLDRLTENTIFRLFESAKYLILLKSIP
jgi:hypothetical protein